MLKRFKQELIFIPVMLILIELFRKVVYLYYPDTAMFDRGSELETYLTRVWQIVWITCGTWVLLRVTFPSVHKALREFYHGFESLGEVEKRGIALKFFFCFFFGLVFLMSGRASETQVRKNLVDTITSQLHVRELTGHNDGIDVEKYLAFVNQTKGASWCAAFTSYNLNAIGVSSPPNPKSAWSPSFAAKHIVWSPSLEKQHKVKAHPQPGDCFTLYFDNLKRVGHVGFIIGEDHGYFVTIEGNTGLTGSREGSGVHKYKRLKQKVFAVTNYITPYIKQYENKNLVLSAYSFGDYIGDDNLLLFKKAYSITGKNSGENLCSIHQNGFTYTERHYPQIQRGQCKDFSICDTGQKRRSEPAGDSNRNATNEIRRINYRWKGERTLCMQRFGKKGNSSKQNNKGAYSYCAGKATRETCYTNHRSKVYPKVG